MKTFLQYSVLVLALAMGTSTRAHAREHEGHEPPQTKNPPCDNVAPEVDPSMAITGFSMLGGTLMVLRSRLRK